MYYLPEFAAAVALAEQVSAWARACRDIAAIETLARQIREGGSEQIMTAEGLNEVAEAIRLHTAKKEPK